MIKAQRVGLTVVCFINGAVLTKTFSNEEEVLELYEEILSVDESDKESIRKIKEKLAPTLTAKEIEAEEKKAKIEKEIKQQKSLLEWMQEIRDNGDKHFEVSGNKLYMKGIKITVPEFLALEFAHRRENEGDFKSLINFWRLCALNPDPRCREDLFGFLIKNNITVTPSGYFIAYRNVNIKETGNKELHDCIVNTWFKVKNWKKSPKNYIVYLDNVSGKYNHCTIDKSNDILSITVIGNLANLYENLDSASGTVYTDAHTGTFTIKLGQVVSMPREECNADPEQTCSRGLHLGNVNFMRNNRSCFGKEGIICLCSPTDVVAVPSSYDGKMRTCSYLPIALSEYNSDGTLKPVDTSTFEFEYAEYTVEQLEDLCKTRNFEELKEHEIIPKEIDLQSIKNILTESTTSLEEMNKVISGRIIKTSK